MAGFVLIVLFFAAAYLMSSRMAFTADGEAVTLADGTQVRVRRRRVLNSAYGGYAGGGDGGSASCDGGGSSGACG